MKVVALWLLLAVNALAYNPFPIKAYVQRGNGPLVEVPELAGKPDPDRTYRLWFTNVVYTEVWEDSWGEVTTNTWTRRDGYGPSDYVKVTFEFEPDVGDASLVEYGEDVDGVLYLGVFNNGCTNPATMSNWKNYDGLRGFDAWYVPDEYDVEHNTKQWSRDLTVFRLPSGVPSESYSSEYSERISLTLTTNSFSYGGSTVPSVPNGWLMTSTNLGETAYLARNTYKAPFNHGSQMMGIDCNVRQGKLEVVFPGNQWGNVAAYIDICGASILGDPSQELKIEQFDIDFTKSDGQYVIEEWDNYEVPSVGGQSLWQVMVKYHGACPSCGESPCVYEQPREIHDITNHTITVPTEVTCYFCGTSIPLAKSYDEYRASSEMVITEEGYTNRIDKLARAYHSFYTEQVNLHFIISVPVDWVEDVSELSYQYGTDLYQTGLTMWVSLTKKKKKIAVFGYEEADYHSSLYRMFDRRYHDANVVDITPEGYNPLRKLLRIRGTYWVSVRNNPGGDLAILGNELKQSFYHFTYQGH